MDESPFILVPPRNGRAITENSIGISRVGSTTWPSDRRYHIWVLAPDMIKYGYTTGYSPAFNNSNKREAVLRAKREYARFQGREGHHATKKGTPVQTSHERDPVGHTRGVRAREIVRLAAEQVKDPSARYWLLADERGTFEKAARKRLEDTADKARALGMSNAEISVMIALSAVEAFLTRPRKGG